MHRPALALALLSVGLAAQRAAARPLPPSTAAEASGFARTTTLDELRAFVEALGALPRGGLLEVESFGRSVEGRDLLIVRVRRPDNLPPPEGGALRVLVLANIHGGEVCGKEAVQLLLREIANGEHDEVLAACDLWFVPIYNVDGNEKIDPANRPNVNGPVGGLGARENGQGLDLNRDCVKTESPEFRALLSVFGRIDPQVLFDLHTTNGSPHGYHLTYAPPLCTNVDPDLDRHLRARHLPAVRESVAVRHGYRIFDYGNFTREEPPAFATFDHRPRFLTNYYGLRNRLALLSEAYAYEPFEVRVRATRAFVLESLRVLAMDAALVRELCAAADARCLAADGGLRLGWDTSLVEGEEAEVLVGAWDAVPLEGRARRTLRRSELRTQRMRVQTAFVSRRGAPLPAGGWALVDPGEPALEVLRAHGVEFTTLAADFEAAAETFVPRSGDKAPRAPWGARTRTIELRGTWRSGPRTLAAGTAFVPARQRLARVAAQLLEPESEDGLATWGFFEERTRFADGGDDPGAYPVLRLASTAGLVLR
jgi:hypothetical protein